MKVLLVLLSVACFLRFSAAQASDCSVISGYAFYRLQECAGAQVLGTAPDRKTLANIAASCDTTKFCNAFTTMGDLLTVPMVPSYTLMDGSAPDAQACDGTYVALNKTISGLKLPADIDFEASRRNGYKKAMDMQAAVAAAAKVAAKLREKGNDKQRPNQLPSTILKQAFIDSGTPLAQASATIGTYTYGDVLAALTYPVWDSRAANSTQYNYISSVKDQGSCGSCVAFAVTGAAEAVVGTVTKTLLNTYDFSEQWLFFCTGTSASCTAGWYAESAISIIAQNNIPYEVNYPYTASPGCALKSAPEQRAGGTFNRVAFSDLTSAKEHIRTYGSVTSYFAVYGDFWSVKANSPPYAWDSRSALAGYHQVLVVGYNDTGAYWIVKNSWGTGWGDGGYFRMSYFANVGFMSASAGNIFGFTWGPSGSSSPPPSRPPPPSPPPSRPPPPRPPPSRSPSPPPSRSPSPPPPRPPPPSPPPPRPPPPSPFPPSPIPYCGDGVCSASETCASCSVDCAMCTTCGDGICSGGETCLTCIADCGIRDTTGVLTCCGDGMCSGSRGETCATCPKDCNRCSTCNRNYICESELGEKCTTATSGCVDCGSCNGDFCGDGRCTYNKSGYKETCSKCPQDCGSCTDTYFCGDGKCTAARNETSRTCTLDCSYFRFSGVVLGKADNGNSNGNGNGKPPRKP